MKALKKNLSMLFVLMIVGFMAGCGDSDDPSPGNVSNELEDLPEDTGGTHTAKLLGSTTAQFGYYEYLPGGYETNSNEYPVLIFLHGGGEKGDGSNTASVLNKVLSNGPPKLIKAGTWDPKYPMIVISPQYHPLAGDKNANNWGGGNPERLKKFIEYVMAAYRVNESRIYLTGLSYGGNGTYDYLTGSVDDTQSYIAAAAPIAGYGAPAGFAKSKNTPIWSLIGENDGSIAQAYNFTTKYNAQSPAPKHQAKLTVFNGAGHDVWTRVYSGSGIGNATDSDYNPFDKPLYDWMFEHKRAD